MRLWTTLPFVLPALLYGVATGCSDSDSSSDAAAAGASGAGGNLADVLLPLDGNSVTGFDADEAGDGEICSAQSQQAVLVPVDMHIMMDSSGSMADVASGTQMMKWEAVSTALGEFLANSGSMDMGVGIQFFPLREKATLPACPNTTECGTEGACLTQQLGDKLCFDRCTSAAECGNSECIKVSNIDQVCSNVTCQTSSYTTPEVEIAPLPGVAQDIIQAMQAQRPEGGTPTVPALQGAIAYAAQWATAHPERKSVVVFATDGLPTLCPFAAENTPEQQQNIEQAKSVAAQALAGSPPVSTFVIGVVKQGEADANLHAIAAAGGTQKAFMVEPNQDVVAQFRTALEKIRGQMECVFKLPESDGAAPNYMKVNVVYNPSAGGAYRLNYVGEASKCSDEGGWYYDVDPATSIPAQILLCPKSCEAAQADQYSRVDIEIGCKTQVPPPK